ncbi:LamG-like jellyroll fold domain-containing protein [Algibacter sp. 2305UL17-15]|uniref:LamG-like jellyroll fold domain-containing protein n=1 Tax=Algibacter sp. 2305UL17-15 TaxID=3231268 RepID=UPI00345A65D0
MKTKLLLSALLTSFSFAIATAQTNAPSIQSGVTFQWNDVQTVKTHPATIKSITVNGIVYLNFGFPTGYQLTQLGPTGHSKNVIYKNGVKIETTSASGTWNTSALTAFQDLNLNHYFGSDSNGANICDNYTAESTTNAQRQTLTYGTGISATSSGVIAVTERNANNCLHLELFGIPAGGGPEQSLGETFINKDGTRYGFGGTGKIGPNGLGTPGALNAPSANSDYWLSDRVVENVGTLGIALFYLDDVAPDGSLITKAQLTGSSSDHADGKLIIFTLEDYDKDGYSDVDDLDDDNDGIKDTDESGGIDPSADADMDGTENYKDADYCTLNAYGICANLDADTDGIPNHFDLDSDNDGITDVRESGGTDTDNNSRADGSVGYTVTTNGIPSSAGSGNTPGNTDGVGNADFLDIDADNDGIPDNVEAQSTTGYSAPSMTIDTATGIYNNYGTGLVLTDTDGDGVYDYIDLDSDNDGTPDIEENGMANTILNADTDSDGLDNTFEGGNLNDGFDVNDEINNPSDASILPDTDGDLVSGGDLDYRDVFSPNPPSIATIDFDGVDDYVDSGLDLSGFSQLTAMAWVKLDPAFSGNGSIISQGDFQIMVSTTRVPIVKVNGYTKSLTGSDAVTKDIWTHVTVVFNSAASSDKLKVYINGNFKTSSNDTALNSSISTSTDAFTIGKNASANSEYFKGNIDEVRVFDTALTSNQIQKIIYQEIFNDSGSVKGAIVPKPIKDDAIGSTVSWSSLNAYYPMTGIINTTTDDFSSKGHTAKMHNILTVQEQTAPMPYKTSNSGSWETSGNWVSGAVWNMYELNNSGFSIVQVSNDMNVNSSLKTEGLILDSGKTLTVNGDNEVYNNYYLELNGTLDLMGDSQLIQTEYSDLVTSATGKVLRRQEGTSSAYWYNYWASPVGSLGATSLTDNNAATNNANNSPYNLQMIKDDSGFNCQFTSNYTANGNISTYWLFTYINGLTYWDWAQIATSANLSPGIGYTQKGTGVPSSEQQYIFEGKPNNGTILIPVEDKGGPGSVAGTSKTEFLLGNPYPSAIDVHQFIDDNAGVIDGTLQLWQQWSGTSHNLRDYNGGYAQVNKLGGVRARQFVGFNGETTGGEIGATKPSRYLPVGQGFMVEIIADGDVEFNNGQRIFIKEADADGTYNNGSAFFKGGNKKSKGTVSNGNNSNDALQKIRLEFNSVTGPEVRRELLLGFSETTSDAFDYGYDAECVEANNNDLNLNLEGKNMNIQAYGAISEDKVVPLNFKSSGDNTFEIRISELEHIEENQEIYLKDNLTGEYFDLTNNQPYRFSSEQGKFNNRLEIVFQSEASTLGAKEVKTTDNFIYYHKGSNMIFAKKLNGEVTKFTLFSMTGQSIMELNNVSQSTLNKGIKLSNVSTGAYVACFRTDTNTVITKKLIIN